MDNIWSVTATVVHTTDPDWTPGRAKSCIQVPSFLLDGHAHGILDEEGAKRIARNIILCYEPQYETVEVHVSVARLT